MEHIAAEQHHEKNLRKLQYKNRSQIYSEKQSVTLMMAN
jgi:hypothetical protein